MLRKFITGLIRQRRFLLRSGRSLKNRARMLAIVQRFERHLAFYPNISEGQLRSYLLKHIDDVVALMPSGTRAGEAMRERFFNLVNL